MPHEWYFYLLLSLVGIGVGAYGTLIGAGGGFLLVPILLFLYPKETPAQLTAISLAAVFANAASGSVAYLRAGRVDVRTALPFAAATIPGSVLGALLIHGVARGTFELIFGAVLGVLALYLLWRPERPAGASQAFRPTSHRRVVDAQGNVYEYSFNLPLGIALSLGVGFVSSFLGIGGGIIHVPVMTQLLGFPVHLATGTSHAVLAVMAGTATAVHALSGVLDPVVRRTLVLAAGLVVGAQFGARLSARTRGPWIVRLLGLGLLAVAARLLVSPWLAA
jgi:uncharacterized membrane protein YfcA